MTTIGAPAPMRCSQVLLYPGGRGWLLQPSYDGQRLLVRTTPGGARGWSRTGVELTPVIGELLAPFSAVAAGYVFDCELVSLAPGPGGAPVQDFAAVARALRGADMQNRHRLRIVAFDVAAHPSVPEFGTSVRLRDRMALLAETLPTDPRVRPIETLPVARQTHAALLEAGFEGIVFKRARSWYRPYRTGDWRKLMARRFATVTVLAVERDRGGPIAARCVRDDGRELTAWGFAGIEQHVGRPLKVLYTRRDANGDLRQAQLLRPRPSPGPGAGPSSATGSSPATS